ncbi:hypothetical protein ACGTI2_12400 [Morganella morganii]|uniref:hypothetical protein n=1 Tax=Morganella morganii TaxID=582 RepID=UPI0038708A44
MSDYNERQNMIIRALNDTENLMQPVDDNTFTLLEKLIGEHHLVKDVAYLISAGLIDNRAIQGDMGGYYIEPHFLALTAAGFDYANIDTIGSQVKAVTIRIHQNTIEQLKSIIHAAGIPEGEKRTLLKLLREKGAEAVVSKCVDTMFSHAGAAALVLSELAKNIRI